MQPKLCISTVVDENYEHFIPLFIFCLKQHYPKYFIKIFTHEPLAPEINTALKLIPHYKFEIVPGLFKGWVKHKYSPISWRFVIPPSQYEGFDYVYITDIDMMILKERVSLLDFHLSEMEQTGLCYSNSLRNKGHWKGNESFTGLHFVSQEWFEKTEKSRLAFVELLKTGRVGERREYDGNLLWLMTKDSGLGMPKKYKLVPRHHGCHIGNFRLFKDDIKKLYKRMPAEKCQQWLNVTRQPLYRELFELCSQGIMVEEQINKLNAYCRSMR